MVKKPSPDDIPFDPSIRFTPEQIRRIEEITANPPELTPEQLAAWARASKAHAEMVARRRGRPEKPPEQVRSERVVMRVTGAEHRDIERWAAAQGLDVSEYLRRAVAYCVAAGVPLETAWTKDGEACAKEVAP